MLVNGKICSHFLNIQWSAKLNFSPRRTFLRVAEGVLVWGWGGYLLVYVCLWGSVLNSKWRFLLAFTISFFPVPCKHTERIKGEINYWWSSVYHEGGKLRKGDDMRADDLRRGRYRVSWKVDRKRFIIVLRTFCLFDVICLEWGS